MTSELTPLRRIAAYAVCHDDQQRALLIRESAQSGTPGVWTLPGGGVTHGEHPGAATVREALTETGLRLTVRSLMDVAADTRALPHNAVTLHTDRIIFTAEAAAGELVVGSPKVDQVAWVSRDEAATLQLRPFAAQALKLPLSTVDLPPEELPDLPGFHIVETDGRPTAQRFAAYGVVCDPAGKILLTQIADGYPGAGAWHLPGGGTDFGEQPAHALLREIEEETGQNGRVRRLLDVASHHEPEQLGPEGFPIDWHGVRPYYDVLVDEPRPLRLLDAGGSTATARWFTPDEASRLLLTLVTSEALTAAGCLPDD